MLIFSRFLAGCSPEPPLGQTRTLAPGPEAFTLEDGEATADDVARFLAGRPVRHGAVLSQLQQGAGY